MRTTGTRAVVAATLAVLTMGGRAQDAKPIVHTVTGTVQGMIAGAKDAPRLSLWQHDYHRDAATIVADVRTAADGSFELRDAPWLAGHAWGFAFFVLHARQGDRVATMWLRGDDAARAPLTVWMEPAIELHGHVRGPDGKPVAGASVRLQGLDFVGSGGFFAETPPFWCTRSADDGTFVLRAVPRAGNYSVACVSERLARGRIDTAATDGIDFDLEPGGVLVGRVLLERGAPAVRARVCAQGTQKSGWATATTDDDGRYRLVALADDAYNVWVDVPDLTCAALDRETVELGREREVPPLTAVAGGFFVGRVVDAITGLPVQPGSSADVAIYGPSRPRSGAACDVSPIAPDGTFRIRVAPGSNLIYLRADEHSFQPVDAKEYRMDVATGEEKRVEFRVIRVQRR